MRNIIKYLFLIIFLLFFVEFVAFIVSKFFLSDRGVFFDKKKISQNYNRYLEVRHRTLGWDSTNHKHNLDYHGARVDQSSYKNSKPCIDVYGDSYTYGHFDPKYAWPSQLSELLNCRVRNFGVGGYGSDQAFMKFLSKDNHSKIIFLNHFSENIIRNVNQFRNFIYPSKDYLFKPRFIIRGEELKLVPLPKITIENIYHFLQHPEKYLNNEYFIPNGDSGIQFLKFSYTIKLFKSFNHWHLKKKINLNPSRLVDFYLPNHNSNGLNITYEILNSFYNQVISKGHVPIVTIFPTCRDLEYFNKYKKLPYDNLVNLLDQKKIRYIDFGPIIINRSGDNFKKLYDRCGGHFNEIGETLISKAFFKYINDNNLIRNLK